MSNRGQPYLVTQKWMTPYQGQKNPPGSNENACEGMTLNQVVAEKGWFDSSNEEKIGQAVEEGLVKGAKLAGKYVRGNSKGLPVFFCAPEVIAHRFFLSTTSTLAISHHVFASMC